MHATHFLVSFIRLFKPELFTLTGLCISTGLGVTASALCRGLAPPMAVEHWCAQLPTHSPFPSHGHPSCANPIFPASSLLDIWLDQTRSVMVLHNTIVERNSTVRGYCRRSWCGPQVPVSEPGGCSGGTTHCCPSDFEGGTEHGAALLEGQVQELGSELTLCTIRSNS